MVFFTYCYIPSALYSKVCFSTIGPTNVYRSRRSGRHARVPFTAAQAIALEAAYARAPYLAPPALRALAAALQLRDDRVRWNLSFKRLVGKDIVNEQISILFKILCTSYK